MISGYNTAPHPIRNMVQVIAKQLHIHGFLVNALQAKYAPEFFAAVPARGAAGTHTCRHTHTHMRGGEGGCCKTYHQMMLSFEKKTSRACSSHPGLQGGATRRSRRSVLKHRRGK